MPRNVYVRQTRLTDVQGRIDYISNPSRQEHLYAVYTNVTGPCWERLAEQNQHDFKMSGTKGKCIEARELVIALPETFVEYDPALLLQIYTESFHLKYGVPCIAALHHNRTKSNYHIHLIYSERKLLETPVRKKATRNMFYDENGKHVRTKKEITDENGEIRPGCRIVPKGSTYDVRLFDKKEEVFKLRKFMAEVKEEHCAFVNSLLPEEMQMSVFDPSGPYLATKKIGKNNPLAEQIKKDNQLRQEWNHQVDRALISGVKREQILEIKKQCVSIPVAKSIESHGQRPGFLAEILINAIKVMYELVHGYISMRESSQRAAEKEAKMVYAGRLKEKLARFTGIDEKLSKTNKKIYAIEKKITLLEQQLEKIPDVFFNRKKRKELQGKVAEEKVKLKKAKEEFKMIPSMYGFNSVDEFYNDYKYLKGEITALKKDNQTDEKKSIKEQLEENKKKLQKSEYKKTEKVVRSECL